ncbi:MAG: class I SAM-dependent methyltransferase [Bdellovibrionales bacterium]|nr:class I SAM-dependent methyltransferase [Bdellovibrionales bacterium]
MSAAELDSPDRLLYLKRTIHGKPSLLRFYSEVYGSFARSLARCPTDGIALELGSGGSFAKDLIPNLVTSDVVLYKDVDMVVDAQKMTFANEALRAVFLMNVLHHIPDSERFFSEAQRCLKSDGRIIIFDQYPGFFAKPILKYFHHEGFDNKAKSWIFISEGPLSSANGALAWNIFFRDREIFETKFPNLKIQNISYHFPLLYWLSGGLKKWNLAPKGVLNFICAIEAFLLKLSKNFASFVTIEIAKKRTPG